MPQTYAGPLYVVPSLLNVLCDFVVAVGLKQFVTFPTHNGGNTLDLVFSAIPGLFQSISRCSLVIFSL